jgi:hypothetical protein
MVGRDPFKSQDINHYLRGVLSPSHAGVYVQILAFADNSSMSVMYFL